MITYSSFDFYKSAVAPTVPGPSTDYTVRIGDEEIPAYSCRISAYPFNRIWPGHQRPVSQTVPASFVNIVADESVTLSVTSHLDEAKMILKPRRAEERLVQDGNTVTFTLTEPGGYALLPDHYAHMLYIFVTRPLPTPKREDVTHYFGPGVHFAGQIALSSGQSVYLDKDAYVFGEIYACDAEDIRIFGNGILDGGTEERVWEACFGDAPIGNCKLKRCKKVRIESVGFANAATWCMSFWRCEDVMIDGIRIFGQWRYNTDGVDMVNCRRMTLKNSFIHSFDDGVVIKGVSDYKETPNEDISVEHCSVWCDWGKALELGLETYCPAYRRITFKDIDVLRGGNTVCDLQMGDCAVIEDVTFSDIRIEMEHFFTPEVYQASENQVYAPSEKYAIPFFLGIGNEYRMSTTYGFWGEVTDSLGGLLPTVGEAHFAACRRITVKDIALLPSKELFDAMGGECAKAYILNAFESSRYEDILISGVTLCGKPLAKEDVTFTTRGSGNTDFRFE
ncbi:MAG: hypothetical protein IJV96_00465 [Clostridia bacterium]|nr:hypothetical protein [Clostridia bacterium]